MRNKNRVDDYMTEYPCLVEPEVSIQKAAELMEKHNIRHLPVVHGEQVVGIVSDRDLKQFEIVSDSLDLLVSDVMTKDPYCIPVGTPLEVVASAMAKRKYGCAIITNRLRRVVGIFTTVDGMTLLSRLIHSDDPYDLRGVAIEEFIEPVS